MARIGKIARLPLERAEFDRERKLKQMGAREQERAVDQGESKWIRVNPS